MKRTVIGVAVGLLGVVVIFALNTRLDAILVPAVLLTAAAGMLVVYAVLRLQVARVARESRKGGGR